MKIVVEGDHAEVMAVIQAMAGFTPPAPTKITHEEVVEASVKPEPQDLTCPSMFEELVRLWAVDFDTTGTAHWADNAPINPDKEEKLREVGLHRSNGRTLKWIESCGGLTRAIFTILGDKTLARLVAVNIAQVGSILFPDITPLLEHFDPFEEE